MNKSTLTQISYGIFLIMGFIVTPSLSKPLDDVKQTTTVIPLEKKGRNIELPDEEVMVLEPVMDSGAMEMQNQMPVASQERIMLVPVAQIQDGDGEILETAHNMVFRPLFAYRRIQSQRRRVYYPSRRYDFPTIA